MEISEIKAKLEEHVAKGLNFGIESVDELINESSQLYNDYILLKSQYNDLMHLSSLNTLPYEQIEIGLNRLRKNLLRIIDKLEPDHLQKEELKSNLKIQALPTRRTNFFKLLDIHFKNLGDIHVEEISSEATNRIEGREAVFYMYRMYRHRYGNREEAKGEAGLDFLRKEFYEYFKYEKGMWEVYFKNIKHLIRYTLDSEIEQAFFLNTLQSIFSRYELVMLFYYALSDIDPEMTKLLKDTQIIDPVIKDLLIDESLFELVLDYSAL